MEEELEQIVLRQSAAHPGMEPADYVKLFFQNEFGCAHGVPDPGRSLELLLREAASLPPEAGEGPLFEPIGNGLCRVRLAGGREAEEFLPLLNRMFVATAGAHRGDRERFGKKLESLIRLAAEGTIPVGPEEMRSYVDGYLARGGGPVHHSRAYAERYSPHYRVVRLAYLEFLPVFRAAVGLGCPAVLAVDGRCGSGKTSLAALLREVFGCAVFHVDDFFLPMELRTPERLAEPGGNIDRGRLLREVLAPLRAGEKIRYRPYSCLEGKLLPPVEERPGALAVVEGTYALHPDFLDFYGLKVFLTCSPAAQQRRIFLRNGGEWLHDFLETWIPAEERYFESMRVNRNCDLTLDTSGFGDFG